jgi:hypothetical protein
MTTIRISVLALAAALVGCSQHVAEQLEPPAGLVSAHGTITQAADESRAGWYPDQPLLDPATVSGPNFKRIFKTQLQPGFSQQVLAQPLVVGGKVLVVTEANNAYLVDALTGAVLLSRNLGPAFDATTVGCSDVIPTVGITGTPVVDVATNTAYFYAKSSAGGWTLHAVNADDLTERAGFPVTIGGSAQNDATAAFNSPYQLQRPGLLLMDGVVYAGFGSHCGLGPYRGWVIGVTTAGVIRTMFTTLANTTAKNGSSIWMSGAGLVSDGAGQILFATGNGDGNPYAHPLPGNTPPGSLQNAVVRLVVQADGTLKVADFFAPMNAVALNNGDRDLGSGGVVALPAQFGTAAIPHLAVIAGKAGTIYLLDRDNLGGFQQGPGGGDAVLTEIATGGASWSRPGVWPGDGGYVYVTLNGGTSTAGFDLEVYKYGTDAGGKPTLAFAGKAPDNVGAYSGSPIVTSNGLDPGSALVWMTNLTSELRIYDAVPVDGVLNIRFRDSYGAQAKFTTIGVGAGAAYIGTADGYLVGYGAGTPSVTGSPVAFGAVGVGLSRTVSATLTAGQNVTVRALSSSNGAFTLGAPSPALPAALGAGQRLTVPVTFTPATATSYLATLAVTTSSTPGALTMTGTGQVNGPQLAVSPGAVDFGGVAVGTSKSTSLSLRNSGTSSLTFAALTPPGAPFSVSGAPANGATLAPGAATTMTVTFAPTAAAAYTGSLRINSNGGNVTISLAGVSGTPANLVVTPLDNDFGTVVAGTTKTLSFTLRNTGGVDLTITRSKPPALGPFVAQTSLLEGSMIAAGETVTETVQFAAHTAGVLSDVWAINGSDATGLHTVTFTANSVAPLPRNGWVATAPVTGGSDVPAQAIDLAQGSTRWSTGLPQSNAATQSFTLDLSSPQTFSMIQVDSGGDYARNWELYTSDDPASWGTPIATGTATSNPMVITFPTQTHRYLQIRQLASPGTGSWWSIYDLNVFGLPGPVLPGPGPLSRLGWTATGSSTAGGDVAQNALDVNAGSRWSTGLPQSNAATQSFTVDMQAAQTFNQIMMDSSGDYCRSYEVYVSADGSNWGSAVTTGSAMTNPVILTFATQTARFLQIRQLTSPGTSAWWSIWDFEVIAEGTPPKTPLPRTGWTESASRTAGGDLPAQAIDSATSSRWSTGLAQSDGSTQSFTLDMQTAQTISEILMVSGGDYARNWQVYVSSDGASWGAPVATGAATASPVTVAFAPTTARYIQIRQTTSPGTISWWSIYDLDVYGP